LNIHRNFPSNNARRIRRIPRSGSRIQRQLLGEAIPHWPSLAMLQLPLVRIILWVICSLPISLIDLLAHSLYPHPRWSCDSASLGSTADGGVNEAFRWTQVSCSSFLITCTQAPKDTFSPQFQIVASEKLDYHACYGHFFCARLQLPLDWQNASHNHQTVAIAVVRLPAKVPITDTRYGGAIIVNPGRTNG
jgi:hypothetical protein